MIVESASLVRPTLKNFASSGKILLAGDGELPMLEVSLCVAAHIGYTVCAQTCRCVVVWIKTDAQKMCFCIERRVGSELLFNGSEVACNAGQKLGSGQRV